MISSSHLSKLIKIFLFIYLLIFNNSIGLTAVDIWEKKEGENKKENQLDEQEEVTIESPILSDDINKIKISEDEIGDTEKTVIGIFDPEKNNFNLNMWADSDGEDIKKILKRINKLKLSKTSEDLLFRVLFTNAYPPNKNLSSEDFLKIKINWLIDKNRVKDLETFLKANPQVGENSKAIKFLIN